MADYILDSIRSRQQRSKLVQKPILVIGKRQVIRAFQLDADGKIVTALTPAPVGQAGVPRALETRNKLDQLAVAADKEDRKSVV